MAIIYEELYLRCPECKFIPRLDESSAKLTKHCERCGKALQSVTLRKEKLCPTEPLVHDQLIKVSGVEGEQQKFCPGCGKELIIKEAFSDEKPPDAT